jgi:predicted MPP superfamily phosphohydrolase
MPNKKIIYLPIVMLLTLAPFSVQAQLYVPPYLQLSPDNGMTVMWNTEQPAYGWVEYGATTDLGNNADLVIEGLRHANTTRHRVVLPFQGRQPLFYRLGWKNIDSFGAYEVKFQEPQFSEIHKVSPLPGPDETVRVAIFNDLHDNHPMFQKLIAQIQDFDYDFSVFNGDCFSDPSSEAAFVNSLNIYNKGVDAAERPVIYHRGNHEFRGAFARELRSWFSPPGGHFYGAFTAGPVRFIMLDAGEDKDDSHWAYSGLNDFSGYRKEQALFLQKEIAGKPFQDATFRVLIHHIPLYDPRDPIFSRQPREAWEEVLEGAPVTLAISGHTHHHVIHQTGDIGNPYPMAIGGGSNEEGGTVTRFTATPEKISLEMLNVTGEIVESLELIAP